MALFREKLPSHRSAAIPASDTSEEIQERNSCTVQTRVNRLKRPKKTAGTATNLELCSDVSSSDQKCRPAAQTSVKKVEKSQLGQTPKEDSGSCSPAKCTSPSLRPPKQSNLNMLSVKASCLQLNEASLCTSNADMEPHIIDLCGDDENNLHMVTDKCLKDHYERIDPPQVIKANDMMTRTSIHRFSGTVMTTLKRHREMRSGWRENFTDKTREELLAQIQAQNRHFSVHQFFPLLLKQWSQFEKSSTGLGTITPPPGAPGFGKRKQELDVLHDDQPLKRQRWSGELSRDCVCGSASQCVNTHNPHSSHSKASSRSRLSVSRRRKQQNSALSAPSAPSALLQPSQCVCCTGEKPAVECVTREEEVLWTEKYQPRHSDGVIGNSASVRKLHSWLKEWKVRADVEERRRRREERRRTQEESSESWDCGDFEGESVMVDSEAELCNTVLIVGPTGVGKTAAVYACAEELGYKVFEVNSSSLRSGQLVLSQLREATQSHQVGAIRSDSPKPQNSMDTVTLSASVKAPSAALKKEASRRAVAPTRKSSRSVPRKNNAASTVTIKHFFKRTDRPENKGTDLHLHQDQQASDSVKPDVLIECSSNAEGSCEERVLNTEDFHLHRKNRTPPISLILFEEVDIIFSEDVGFLTAVKTLMTTTKRPIILTTNDPLFSKTFNGNFEKIHFKTPPLETTRSYLQCVCVVENVWPDPEDLRFLLEECKGDVRRSVLELELWACSGGGPAHRHTQNKTLTCHSWTELDISGCADVLVENWRMGRSLFYSNLELLFTLPSRISEKVDRNMLKADKSTTFEMKLEKDRASTSSVVKKSRTGKLSRLKQQDPSTANELEMTHRSSLKYAHVPLDGFNQSSPPSARTDQSENVSSEKSLSKLPSCCLESLAQFFDTMSFLDSCIYKPQLQVPGQCQSGPLGWMGAQLTDSLVDELREEEVNTHLERCYELKSVLEGLGFHQCRAELSKAQRTVEKLKDGIGGERFKQLMDELIIFESSDASVFQNKSYQRSAVHKSRREVLNKLLSSKAFGCHGNKRAVAVDYLPVLRSICRTESMKQQNRPRFTHYLSDNRLLLPKSVFQMLATH